MRINQKFWYILSPMLIILLAACGSGQSSHIVQVQPITADSLNIAQHPTPTTSITIPKQIATIVTTPSKHTNPIGTTGVPPTTIPGSGVGPTPYGPPPPISSEEYQLTQQLFALINHDRSVRGLYPFVWNATLAGGARLHSFAGFTDCGENIGLAGPSIPPWNNVYAVQESMINEGSGGWHFIHLTSTTLHRIGVGIFVDGNGWVWFTEDMVS